MHKSLDVFLFLAIAGAIEVVWLMAIMAHRKAWEPRFLRQLRRVALAGIGLAFLWGARYALETEWEPWFPCLLAMGGMSAYLGLTIIAAYVPVGQTEDAAQRAEWPLGDEGSGPSRDAHVRAALAAMQGRRGGLNGTSGPSASAKRSESSARAF